ncbi:MAG: hypothetical protein GY854_23620, partial [Deltaproteobacteria bacterium]|nr:hypothetical protein [Deltaproteobacteria bacterium]
SDASVDLEDVAPLPLRILQILDEFQYMNKYVTSDDDPERIELLCNSYMGAACPARAPLQLLHGSRLFGAGRLSNPDAYQIK